MTPTFTNHCITMYEKLKELSKPVTLEDGRQVLIFQGSYTEAWKACDISQTYYSPVKRNLIRHNVIEVLEKGARNVDSIIAVHGLPEKWEETSWNGKAVGEPGSRTGLTKASDFAKLQGEVKELTKLQGGINTVEALSVVEQRLVALEKKMEKLELVEKEKSKPKSKAAST